MFKITKVSIIFILVSLVSSSFVDNETYLNYLGIKQIPHGLGYVFKNLFKVKINFDIEMDAVEIPEKLDCNKYLVHSQSQNRIKRQSTRSDSMISDSLPICAYSFDGIKTSFNGFCFYEIINSY